MALPYHRRERHAFCETALEVGPDAPTLCTGWTARDLVAHLLVREAPGPAAAGIAVPALAGFTERAMAKAARAPYDEMVARLREPGLTPYRLPGVERLVNTLEFFVHHEDLRRAQSSWGPRELPREDEDELWTQLTRSAKLTTRRVGVPVEARRTGWDDLPPEPATIRRGPQPAVVTGRPGELALFFAGRGELHDVTFDGPPAAVSRLRQADLGL